MQQSNGGEGGLNGKAEEKRMWEGKRIQLQIAETLVEPPPTEDDATPLSSASRVHSGNEESVNECEFGSWKNEEWRGGGERNGEG